MKKLIIAASLLTMSFNLSAAPAASYQCQTIQMYTNLVATYRAIGWPKKKALDAGVLRDSERNGLGLYGTYFERRAKQITEEIYKMNPKDLKSETSRQLLSNMMYELCIIEYGSL